MDKILFLGNEEYGANTFEAFLNSIDQNKYSVFLGVKKLDKSMRNIIKKTNFPKDKISFVKSKKEVENLVCHLKPLIGVTASFGIILTDKSLQVPIKGFWNFHPSILPKLRGPSPIRSVILYGCAESGVSIYKMNDRMDSGDILRQEKFKIEKTDFFVDVYKKVCETTIVLINHLTKQVIMKDGQINLEKQSEKEATYCKKIFDKDGYLTFQDTKESLVKKVRALSHNPGVCFQIEGKRFFIRGIFVEENMLLVFDEIKPFSIIIRKQKVFIKLKKEVVSIETIQQEGKKILKVRDFCNGWKGKRVVSWGPIERTKTIMLQ